jgi:hypothetical protein
MLVRFICIFALMIISFIARVRGGKYPFRKNWKQMGYLGCVSGCIACFVIFGK